MFDDEFGDEAKEYDDENPFVAERGAYDRVGFDDPFSIIFEKPEPTGEEEHKQWIKGLNKRERFYYILKAEVIPKLESEYGENIDKQLLVDSTINLNGMEYKNPWAFIISFMATKGGTTMDKNRILKAIDKIPASIKSEAGISPEDIIRYCRYMSSFI